MKNSVPFVSPENLRVSMGLPHRGTITGMGIPCGITLIVGGGYHGKSTLLNALELGIYNHISGDGREYVITDSSAQKLRSEDGRFIQRRGYFSFYHDLPNKKTPSAFLQRMPVAALPRLPGSWKVWKPEVKFFFLTRILLPPTLWCGIPSCSA